GKTLSEKRKNYRHAVESSLLCDIAVLSEQAAAEAVLGSEPFIDRMRRAMNDMKENLNVRRESTQQRRLMSWRSIEEVVRVVESAYGVPEKELLRKGNRGCEARQVLLYLAAVHCRGRYSLSEIAELLGPLTISGLDSARSKIMLKMRNDRPLEKRIAQIEKILDGSNDKSTSED
ncbi:MAG: hypothetical protein K9N51_11390, partial [Candidatus Pacebacteria bacterium]|nr:hypothetical protein [Candidatus Paceibacterota bacterium]